MPVAFILHSTAALSLRKPAGDRLVVGSVSQKSSEYSRVVSSGCHVVGLESKKATP